MKTKIVKVKDSDSEVYYSVSEPENVDITPLRSSGIGMGWRIVTQLRRRGFTWTGFPVEIRRAWESKNPGFVTQLVSDGVRGDAASLLDGTDWGFLIALSQIAYDIPDQMDVTACREEWIDLKNGRSHVPAKRKAEKQGVRGPCYGCKTDDSPKGFFMFDKRPFCSAKCKWSYVGKCPTCDLPREGYCKCMRSDSTCQKGHSWHICIVHDRLVLGSFNHRLDTDDCSCG